MVTFAEEQRPPYMVIEITSTRSTRNDDLIFKPDQYLGRGINQYVVVDRDKDNKKKKEKHDPSKICYIKNNSGSASSSDQDSTNYSKHEFRNDEKIDVTLLRHLDLNSNDIFGCPTGSLWEAEQKRKENLKIVEIRENAEVRRVRDVQNAEERAEERRRRDVRNAEKETEERLRREFALKRKTLATREISSPSVEGHSPTGTAPEKKKTKHRARSISPR